MSTTTIKISSDFLPSVKSIVEEFGFDSEEEFFQEAIRDKILELQKQIFFKGSSQVAEKLKKKGVTETELLQEFSHRKHS